MNLDDVEILERKTVCQSYFRIDRYVLRHRLFDGGWSKDMFREVFERGHSVVALLYDAHADAVVLVEQFRAGALAAGMGPWLIECVAGIVDEGETPDQVARREAMEEAGCAVGRLEFVGKFLYSTGACSEVCQAFVGEIDSSKAGGVFGLADEHEDIKTHIVPAATAFAWLDDGTLTNAALIITLSWLARHHETLRCRWMEAA
jgi:ADP-ribose pyrophosphatase